MEEKLKGSSLLGFNFIIKGSYWLEARISH